MANEEETWSQRISKMADSIAANLDADVLVYNGRLERPQDDRVIEDLLRRRRRKHVLLVLITPGGDAHAAYRIARFLHGAYQKFTLFVSGECKSAGTLVAVAAHELVMSNFAELGPLDIQMDKKGELWDLQSGLTVQSAIAFLHEKSFLAFEHFVTECRRRRMQTQISADVAVKLTAGLFSGIYSQIDPLHAGEAARQIAISARYGSRLEATGKNLKDRTLARLISDYPAHGFVIDKVEASELFKNVRGPSQEEEEFVNLLGAFALHPMPYETRREPLFWIVSSEPQEPPKEVTSSKASESHGDAHANQPEKTQDKGRPGEHDPAANGDPSANQPDAGAPPRASRPVTRSARSRHPRGV